MKRLKQTIAVLLCTVILFGMTACSLGGFDAKGYTQALLDQMFQGATKDLAKFDKETTQADLEKQYRDYINVFASGMTEGLNISDVMMDKYISLCKEIFRTQKYAVTKEEKISKKEYKVIVEIQPTDVFVKWNEELVHSMEEIQKRAEGGIYKGSETEILSSMQEDIVLESYDLLKKVYEEQTYGEAEEIVLTIKQGESEKFQADDEEISQLITKILCLDAILD